MLTETMHTATGPSFWHPNSDDAGSHANEEKTTLLRYNL